jgi:uncharacterized protein YegP (UPF0339 family)
MNKYEFVVYQSEKDNRWYWRLVSSNGLIVAQSAGGIHGGYKNKQNAVHIIDRICRKIDLREIKVVIQPEV